MVALAMVSSACSIEHTREIGAECLQDRECVTGLICAPRPDNRTVCQRPFTGSLPMSDVAATDAAADVPTDAPRDAAADATGDAAAPGDADTGG